MTPFVVKNVVHVMISFYFVKHLTKMPKIACTDTACASEFDNKKQLNNHIKGHHLSPVEVTYVDVDGLF
jgi:hypothetical protein